MCDLCSGASPVLQGELAVRSWRSDFDPAVAREMAAMASRGSQAEADAVGVARALCQVLTPRSRPYRRHPAWGSLERAPYGEVLAAVREALGAS